MIKSLIKSLISKTGYQVVRVPERSQPQKATIGDNNWHLQELIKDPLKAELHLKYALDASANGQIFLAYAELKTAECLGYHQAQIEKLKLEYRGRVSGLEYMNHNQYFRFATLADEIVSRAGNIPISILDVGGGQGQLAAFLPENFTYCLAEPTVNGISGINLPFPDRTFDFVISCHVLEHIPIKDRNDFLDQLLSKSKKGVILLNPFHVERSHVNERLQLIIDITGAQWAKEHLDCSLPKINDIRHFASQRGLQFSAKPNGTMTTSLSFVFIDYLFGITKGHSEDRKKINAFYNKKYLDILDSENYPTAYLVYIGWQKYS